MSHYEADFSGMESSRSRSMSSSSTAAEGEEHGPSVTSSAPQFPPFQNLFSAVSSIFGVWPLTVVCNRADRIQAKPQASPSDSSSTALLQPNLAQGNPTGAVGVGIFPDPPHAARIYPDAERVEEHLRLITGVSATESDSKVEDIKTTPLFTNHVKEAVEAGSGPGDKLLQQFGLLGMRKQTYNCRYPDMSQMLSPEQNLVYANMNAPWSAFICGSQGAGKSHSLSCLLEIALLVSSPAGENPRPLAGLVFHYDKFSGSESTQLCEAAYLCSTGIPVRVLVSPSNVHAMRKLYRNLPGLAENAPRPEVMPLYFQEHHPNVSRMMALMAVQEGKAIPLYMEVLVSVLREMMMENEGASGLNYLEFKDRLARQEFSPEQKRPLKLRLELLESFLAHHQQTEQSAARLERMYDSAQGTLTIVDLSCPLVTDSDACALFTIVLSIFVENRGDCGRVIALDEAHKFLTQSGEAEKLTDKLISIVSQQRHLGTRIIVATQAPTLAPRLLDLCTVSIVHRFNSPAWLEVLRKHLAGASLCNDQTDAKLFELIVGMHTGEALIFAPSAMLDVVNNEVCRLLDGFVRVMMRNRITTDGGRSILASDETKNGDLEEIPADEVIRPFKASTRPSASVNLDPVQAQLPIPAIPTAPRALLLPQGPNATTITAIQPAAGITEQQAKLSLSNAVARSLDTNPRAIFFDAVRNHAALSVGLRVDFFVSSNAWKKFSRTVIHEEVARYVNDHGIEAPVKN
ncbi:hypothetical protein H2200_006905 [Cladophialophora chaetospira]|uniref:AAA+ ATPase domain-containing protein n=1 Tax=Cladophialophora chaetospira TaxID=386627 RepID=A0AA39CIB5_9EURO|nr:hypothetical protein H2200_006905 [Cladophialophora chaetospira]